MSIQTSRQRDAIAVADAVSRIRRHLGDSRASVRVLRGALRWNEAQAPCDAIVGFSDTRIVILKNRQISAATGTFPPQVIPRSAITEIRLQVCTDRVIVDLCFQDRTRATLDLKGISDEDLQTIVALHDEYPIRLGRTMGKDNQLARSLLGALITLLAFYIAALSSSGILTVSESYVTLLPIGLVLLVLIGSVAALQRASVVHRSEWIGIAIVSAIAMLVGSVAGYLVTLH